MMSQQAAAARMESIPESPSGSPVFYHGISQLEIPIGFSRRNRSYSGHDDLSGATLTSSIQNHEARVLRLCNKKYPLLPVNDNMVGDVQLPPRFAAILVDRSMRRSRDADPDRGTLNDDVPSTDDDVTITADNSLESSDRSSVDDETQREEDIKDVISWTKRQLFNIREQDRQLLRTFIEIRFKIESLGCQLQRWTSPGSLASCRDLSSFATLPRSPTNESGECQRHFRQRALSLRTPKVDYSPSILRRRKECNV